MGWCTFWAIFSQTILATLFLFRYSSFMVYHYKKQKQVMGQWLHNYGEVVCVSSLLKLVTEILQVGENSKDRPPQVCVHVDKKLKIFESYTCTYLCMEFFEFIHICVQIHAGMYIHIDFKCIFKQLLYSFLCCCCCCCCYLYSNG
jgi:hypothetical protein